MLGLLPVDGDANTSRPRDELPAPRLPPDMGLFSRGRVGESSVVDFDNAKVEEEEADSDDCFSDPAPPLTALEGLFRRSLAVLEPREGDPSAD